MSTFLGGKCITLYISADHRRFRSKLRVLNNWRWCRGWRQGLVGLHTSDTGTAGVEGAGGTGGPGRGAGGRWRGLAGLRGDAPSQRLAARTARGRAAAHRHTQRPGPTAGPSGARNTSGATENVSRETSAQPPASLPRMARKVAHLTYTVLCNFMQRMACLD